mmetsp:Transcript_20337/g.52746  ORF Transcript_20337/g.52746 Transcript_20337/m.52746 type:complete len:255 (-) Transcript_20337:190-954(-)
MPPKKKGSSGKKKAKKGSKAKKGKKGKGADAAAAVEEGEPWDPGENPHAETCKCRSCLHWDEYAEIKIVMISPSDGGPKSILPEVKLPGVELARLPRMGYSFAFVANVTPVYVFGEVRDLVADRVYCIPSDVTLYLSEEAAAMDDPLDLTSPVADVVDTGPEEDPPTTSLYAMTSSKRYGGYASSGTQSYLSTGAPLVHTRERVLVHTERKSVISARQSAAIERTSRAMLGGPMVDGLAPSTITTTVEARRVPP